MSSSSSSSSSPAASAAPAPASKRPRDSGSDASSRAAIAPPPITIATAFEISRVSTTHPQTHDILMDLVVTEAGVQGLEGRVLQQLDLAHAAARLQALALARGLPRQQGAGR